MLIKSEQYSYKPQFKAQKIAKVKNCYQGLTTHIDIYRIDKNDKKFLEKLLNNIDFKILLPKLSSEMQKLYQDIFRATVYNAMEADNVSYIALNNNIPCGLFALKPGKNMNFLDLVSIPVDKNKTINLVGQTLLYQGFLDSKKINANKIQIEAVKNSIGNPVQKYREWGLVEVTSGDRYVQMECDKPNINKQLKRFAQKIQYRKVKEKSTNLEKLIN